MDTNDEKIKVMFDLEIDLPDIDYQFPVHKLLWETVSPRDAWDIWVT